MPIVLRGRSGDGVGVCNGSDGGDVKTSNVGRRSEDPSSAASTTAGGAPEAGRGLKAAAVKPPGDSAGICAGGVGLVPDAVMEKVSSLHAVSFRGVRTRLYRWSLAARIVTSRAYDMQRM